MPEVIAQYLAEPKPDLDLCTSGAVAGNAYDSDVVEVRSGLDNLHENLGRLLADVCGAGVHTSDGEDDCVRGALGESAFNIVRVEGVTFDDGLAELGFVSGQFGRGADEGMDGGGIGYGSCATDELQTGTATGTDDEDGGSHGGCCVCECAV